MLIECNSDEPDEWTIVGLHGALDFDRSGSIRKLLLDNVRSHGCVLADFSAVTRIDSAGIACIIEAYRAATKNGGRFELAGANQQVMRMLKLNRLDKVLSIHESEANKSNEHAQSRPPTVIYCNGPQCRRGALVRGNMRTAATWAAISQRTSARAGQRRERAGNEGMTA